MARKIVTAHRIPNDPLRQIYWNCPDKGCQGILKSFLDDLLLERTHTCSICKNMYAVVAIPTVSLATVRLVLQELVK